MSFSGVQFYWFVAVGLIVGLLVGLPAGFYATEINSSGPGAILLVTLLLLYPTVCFYTVLWEIWQRFRLKAVLVVASLGAGAVFIHPFFWLVISVGPTIYWFSRINGIPNEDGDT